jgi:virginiamycin B lyase
MKRLLRLYCCMIFLCLLLAACSNTGTLSTGNGPIDTPTTNTQSTTTPGTTAIGKFQEYPLPQTNSGLMRPAIDHEGRVWFGEMGRNYLAMFDPRTKTFQQITPPHGMDGIMGITVATDDTIWFAEQSSNYIGHYMPNTRQFQVYPLPMLTIPDPSNANKTLPLPCAPNDLAFDTHGNLWFTELNADSLGKLDTHTGAITQFPLSAKKTVQKLDPYGVTVDAQEMVWFTEASNSRLGRLNPNSGQISYFTLPGSRDPLMEVVSDAHGTIWASSFSSGLLLSFNPRTNTFKPYYAPYTGNGAGGIYGVDVAHNGEVWVALTGENTIARLDVAANHFVLYPIPTQGSLPLGLVMGSNHTVWFTEAGKDKIGMLEP